MSNKSLWRMAQERGSHLLQENHDGPRYGTPMAEKTSPNHSKGASRGIQATLESLWWRSCQAVPSKQNR
jgi:hypothetical protein